VLAYLSRYTHRVAIANSRLIACDRSGVTFRWKDYRAEGRDRQKAGGTDVLDAARPGQLCAAGSHARQPVGHPGEAVNHRWADWAPCLPEEVGESAQRIMVGNQ